MIATFGLVATLGCQHRTGGPPGRGDRHVISQAEIDSAQASNVYDLVARLRGDFLKERGRVSLRSSAHDRAVVFLNGQEYGVLETMRNIPASHIREIRYIPGVEAATRFGAQYGGGVILLTSRDN